jgi:hypothetical protein
MTKGKKIPCANCEYFFECNYRTGCIIKNKEAIKKLNEKYDKKEELKKS